MGDTEKEADPVGGCSGAEDAGMERRGGGWGLGVVTQKIQLQTQSQTDTKTLFTELWQESIISKVTPLSFMD